MTEAPGPQEFECDLRFPVILSGPSGAGKTSVRNRLLGGRAANRFLFSISMTTREPRTRETDGVDYRFVDRERFEAFVAAGEMLEHAVVHDECYGTPASNLGDARRAGKHLLLDIDVQGARQVRDLVNDVLSIIVLPPSVDEMFRRLSGRGSETPAQLARRAVSAVSELETVTEFGYVIVNADLDRSVEAVLAIIDAEERAVFRVGERAGEFAERLKDEIERKML